MKKNMLLFSTCLLVTAAKAQLSYLDPGFGNQGVVIKKVGSSGYNLIGKTTLQNNGKILVVGREETHGFITRLLPDGRTDSSFGTNGESFAWHTPGPNSFLLLSDALQFNDRIITGGFSHSSGADTTVLAAFKTDGKTDSSFGNHGILRLSFASSDYPLEAIRHMVKVNDSQFVAMGEVANPQTFNLDILLVKFDKNGNRVSSFGQNGVLYLDYNGQADRGYCMLRSPAGELYIAGSSTYANDSATISNAMVVKVRPDGAIDNTFGNQGWLLQHFYEAPPDVEAYDEWYALAWQGNKLITAGYTGGLNQNLLLLQRISTDGNTDNSFGTNGTRKIPLCGNTFGTAHITDIVITPQQQIIAAGTVNCGSTENFRMFSGRFTAQGMVDSSYGTNGFIRVPGLQNYDEKTTDLILNADGSMYQTGISLKNGSDPSYDIAIIKYKAGQTTGIREENSVLTGSVYPNPLRAGEKLIVELREPATGNSRAVLSDITGRILLQATMKQGATGIVLEIPATLNAGMYLLRIGSGKQIQTKKITIR